jgi:hypothetical protein
VGAQPDWPSLGANAPGTIRYIKWLVPPSHERKAAATLWRNTGLHQLLLRCVNAFLSQTTRNGASRSQQERTASGPLAANGG